MVLLFSDIDVMHEACANIDDPSDEYHYDSKAEQLKATKTLYKNPELKQIHEETR